MALPENLFNQLTEGVYEGFISLFELPLFLYSFTVEKFDNNMFSGFGEIGFDEIAVQQKAASFRQNLGRFSGAKTFQQVRDLTDSVFLPDGSKRPFSEFKLIARTIDENYNVNWLAAEQDSVVLQSINARKWLKFEEEKDLFPVLEYVTVGDDRVRPEHMKLNGLRLPVDHPLWNSIMPQNGWRCRCIVIQREDGFITPQSEVTSKIKPILEEFRNKAEFAYNPGKVGYIFKENGKGQHSYFKIPQAFEEAKINNFGFPPPELITGRAI